MDPDVYRFLVLTGLPLMEYAVALAEERTPPVRYVWQLLGLTLEDLVNVWGWANGPLVHLLLPQFALRVGNFEVGVGARGPGVCCE